MNLIDIARHGTPEQLCEFVSANSVGDPGELSSALSVAVMRQDREIVGILLKHGASPNHRTTNHMPPLHCAVEQQDCEMIQLLCCHGADVNYPNENGYTPLHLAVDVEADTAWQRGEDPSGKLVQLLLNLGANADAVDVDGSTPLTIAKEYSYKIAIDLLRAQ